MNTKKLTIATRQSDLAMWQARHVQGLLQKHHPDVQVELLPMQTQGDRILDQALSAIGGKGLFLKELELALLKGEADLAVHSMKDVPVVATPGLLLDVVLERANPFDALLSRSGEKLEELAAGSRVGTSSLRRQCQVLAQRPDLRVTDLRGNVNTRIKKLQQGDYEAIVLACAGLERLGMSDLIAQTLRSPAWLPAVTQGTICLQYPQGDEQLRNVLQPLNHAETALCSGAERAVSRLLGGSCQMPLAVFAQLKTDKLQLDAMVGSVDGKRIVRSSGRGDPDNAKQLAIDIAQDLIKQGADEIIDEIDQSAKQGQS